MQISPENHRRRWEDVQEAAASLAAGKQASVLSGLGGNSHCTNDSTARGRTSYISTVQEEETTAPTAFLSDEGIALHLAGQYFWERRYSIFFKCFSQLKRVIIYQYRP